MARTRTLLWLLLGAGVLFALSRTRVGGAMLGRMTDQLLALIEREEGLRLTAYQDQAGHWTIGYGHKILPGDGLYPFGARRTITRQEAGQFLEQDLAIAHKAIADAVRVPLNDSQHAALTSLAYNIGATAFRTSTLVKRLNAGDLAGAKAEFSRWNLSGGKVDPILVGRRGREATLFGSEGVRA